MRYGNSEGQCILLYYTTRAVLPQMIEGRTGDMVITSSKAGRLGSPVTNAPSASTFAVLGLSESLMQEVQKHNICVTTLAPSTIVTELVHSAILITGGPERVMHPEDLAELINTQLKLNRRVIERKPV